MSSLFADPSAFEATRLISFQPGATKPRSEVAREYTDPGWSGFLKLKIKIVAGLLFLAGQATVGSAESVSVVASPCVLYTKVVPLGEPCMQTKVRPLEVTPIPLKSTPLMRIAVALNSKPAPGAGVEFYRYAQSRRPETPTFILRSDRQGWLKTPKLSAGLYEVMVHAGDTLQADVFLEVSSRYGRHATAFAIDLQPTSPAPWVFAVIETDETRATNVDVAQAAKTPITERLQAFRGVVTDPSGAVVPGADIQIIQTGPGRPKILNGITSGRAGDFEARLEPGTYVAVFMEPGFKSKFVGFEIATDGSERLEVTLEIGAASQVVTVASLTDR